MQPLKRFTQCDSLTMLFCVFIVLFGVSSTALTTFGKSSNNPPPIPGSTIKGRECYTHDDCNAVDTSSCVMDTDDYRRRCLCGDNSVPTNGLCPDVLKGLSHRCNSGNDCEVGMVCQFAFTNRTIGVEELMSTKTKVCLCDYDNGYVEDFVNSNCSEESECNTHDDCNAIDKSSCVKGTDDYKMRCLCGDNSVPNNGLCPDVLKGLRHRCNIGNDCKDGMVCQFEFTNNTRGGAKLCLCDNGNGYVEDIVHDICSGAVMQAI